MRKPQRMGIAQQGHVILGSHVLMNKLYGAPKEFIALLEGHSFPVNIS